MTRDAPDADPDADVAYRPGQDRVESTRIWAFRQAMDVPTDASLREASCARPEWFWDAVVEFLDLEFFDGYDAVRDAARGPEFTDWYPGGTLNAAHNTLDRHVEAGRGGEPACLWENEAGDRRTVTYRELESITNRVANALVERGVDPGETVGICMPMSPAAVGAMYGCFKAGAVAVPVFTGFGVDALSSRFDAAGCELVFTADGFHRRGRPVALSATVLDAVEESAAVESVVVSQCAGRDVPDHDAVCRWERVVDPRSETFRTRELASTAPCLLLYTSGTTGRPKGVVQTHAGFLVKAAKDVALEFDVRPDDRFCWITDLGWIMGPWLLVGVHAVGGTAMLYSGAPDYPDPDRFWRLVADHDLTHFGTSPSALRLLRAQGDEWVDRRDTGSLRVLGTTGEPIDEQSWWWYFDVVGDGDCPIMNITGGTEAGGQFLSPLPVDPQKPCSVGGPSLGTSVDVVDDDGRSVRESHERGYLVLRDSHPGLTRSLWEGDDRYRSEYWSTWDGLWDHGDWAVVDADGFWYLLGRTDDVLNVAGRRIAATELEGVLNRHDRVVESAVVALPEGRDGAVGAAVVTRDGPGSDALRTALRDLVERRFGKPFVPDDVRFVDALPKTDSGKIQRILVEERLTP